VGKAIGFVLPGNFQLSQQLLSQLFYSTHLIARTGRSFYILALKNCRENLVNLFCVVSDNPADCCRLCVACIATLTYTLNPKSPYFRDSLDELKYQSPVGHYRPILNDLEPINFNLWCMSSATSNLPGHRI